MASAICNQNRKDHHYARVHECVSVYCKSIGMTVVNEGMSHTRQTTIIK